jgi:hypothetical protein
MQDLEWFFRHAKGKKINLSEVNFLNFFFQLDPQIFAQNGWPSKSYSGVEPNSPNAVANVQNEHVRTGFEIRL